MNKNTKIALLVGAFFLLSRLRAGAATAIAPGISDFNKSYNRTAKWEGGYQKNPNDPGNYNAYGQLVGTNMGITPNTYQKWIGKVPTEADMKNMTAAQAKQIFYNEFWLKIRGGEIPWQPVADIFFDGVVNHGRGVKLMQEVLGVAQDNVYAPVTHNALINANPIDLYRAYRQRRKNYYLQLIQQNPSLAVFQNGWMNRINSFNDW